MKKIATAILLLITLTGTFIPCCMTDNCCAEQNVSSKNDHSTEGTCSPFFACSTCPGFVKLTKVLQITEPVTAVIIHHERITRYNTSSYISSFWQPPRLS